MSSHGAQTVRRDGKSGRPANTACDKPALDGI
jgi:hypothetical protein